MSDQCPWDDQIDETAEEHGLARSMFPELDWEAIWNDQLEDVDWLIEPVLERGRLVSLYSAPGIGKSLIGIEWAAALATGRPVLGQPPRPPEDVLYVDLENTTRDIVERLQAYGYGPGDLKRLHYLSFPSFRALDSAAGGAELLECVHAYGATVVIIDTVSRVIEGDENDAATFLKLYRCALVPLKALGVTVMRLDHTGKDLERGQRGSSAKEGDVDDIWMLTGISATRFIMRRTKSRSGHGDGHLEVERHFEPLRHLPAHGPILEGRIAEICAELDSAGLPLDAGRDRIRATLANLGIKAGTDIIREVIRTRKAMMTADLSLTPDLHKPESSDASGQAGPPNHETAGQTRPGQVQVSQVRPGPETADDLTSLTPELVRGQRSGQHSQVNHYDDVQLEPDDYIDTLADDQETP